MEVFRSEMIAGVMERGLASVSLNHLIGKPMLVPYECSSSVVPFKILANLSSTIFATR